MQGQHAMESQDGDINSRHTALTDECGSRMRDTNQHVPARAAQAHEKLGRHLKAKALKMPYRAAGATEMFGCFEIHKPRCGSRGRPECEGCAPGGKRQRRIESLSFGANTT
ncbi:hypothetical protein FH972_023548 [Carpinus fangiana]|uniref:Uncharacterized protein n=1 Tax=Carpinus fangiana TaxID=176857 RepID=A0A5N6KVV9_9ROSI|nr:hypothetical protein FH972_023548 [Carpinus fangiana]